MKKLLVFLMVLIIAVVSTSCLYQNITFNEEKLLADAQIATGDIRNGIYSKASESFSDELEKALSEEDLEKAWISAIEPLGEYICENKSSGEKYKKYFVIQIIDEYENGGLQTTISYDENEEIAGIFFKYVTIEKPVVKNDAFEEVPVTIGEKFKLDGILTVPNVSEKSPVVLLVPGSGANDKNVTVYSNTVFLDIAQSLAKQGIASLRFDKRFYAYPDEYTKLGAKVTLENEILDDVEFALDFLLNDERIDKENIFVLGHSLGGCLTPYIATSNENVKGIISMAGTLNPLYEVLYNQNLDMEKKILNGNYDDDAVNELKSQMVKVREDIITLRGDMSDIADDEILMGMYAGYQKSAKIYAGENYIDNVKVPILVLQGGADFQVSPTIDYPLWKDALKDRANVTFVLYDNLNHLMMKTNGKDDMSDYQIKSTVDENVINDIAKFVNTK